VCLRVFGVGRSSGKASLSSVGLTASRITFSTSVPAILLMNFEIDLHSLSTASSSLFPNPLHSGNAEQIALNRVF